ncbi:MAG: prevent-host-death protein [Gammaproteobacteria bacterium]|nr:prevent-host-death protein [Gammaproteobacteria bacterium]
MLKIAQKEEVEIRRRDGAIFSLVSKKEKTKSPFDVPGIKTKVSTQNILDAVRESRMG